MSLTEFRTILQKMGAYPAADKIQRLTQIAGGMTPQAQNDVTVFLLVNSLNAGCPAECRVPIFYVADSIVKNARGAFAGLFEQFIHRACGVIPPAICVNR